MFTPAAKNLMLDALTGLFVSAHDGYPGTTGPERAVRRFPGVRAQGHRPRGGGERRQGREHRAHLRHPGGQDRPLHRVLDGGDGGHLPRLHPQRRHRARVHGRHREQQDAARRARLPERRRRSSSTARPCQRRSRNATIVYVISQTTDDFQLATTVGGAAIDLTTLGTFDCVLSKIVEEAFGAQGQHQIASATLNLNG
jgi:hypothetical protein